MGRVYLVRHGETEWNREQRSQGYNDIELSDIGRLQAHALANRLKNDNIDMFFSSSLKRAYETASLIAKDKDTDVVKHKEFMEVCMGKWEGLTWSEIKEKYPDVSSIWRQSPHLAKIPNAESLIKVRERSMGKLMEILNENPDKNILVVSHGITIKTMICAIMGIDISNIHKIRQDNTAVNIFKFSKSGFETLLLNDAHHLGDI